MIKQTVFEGDTNKNNDFRKDNYKNRVENAYFDKIIYSHYFY